MKLRFSLRALLAAMAVAALFCLWMDRPRRTADQFVRAIEQGRYEEADELLVSSDEPTIGPVLSVSQFFARDERNRIEAQRLPQWPSEWLAGKCVVKVRCREFSGLGATIELQLIATQKGLDHRTPGNSVGMIRYAPDPIMQRFQVR